MDKYSQTILIAFLLLISSSGCSPSSQVTDDISGLLDKTSAINTDLDELKSNIDDEFQKLRADIQDNANHTETKISVIETELDGLETNLTNEMQQLQIELRENNDRFKNEYSTLKTDLDGLKSGHDNEFQQLQTALQENTSLIGDKTSIIKFKDFESSMNTQVQQLQTDIQENTTHIEKETLAVISQLKGLESKLANRIRELDVDIQTQKEQLSSSNVAIDSKLDQVRSKQTLNWTIAILVIVLIVAGILFFIKYELGRLGNIVSSNLDSSINKVRNDTIQLDAQLLNILEHRVNDENLTITKEAEPDHILPKKVCEEIQRMRNRMKHMDENDQARKVFGKRLDSLEDQLNTMGYEMAKLENLPFDEGMIVTARFIPDETRLEGERIITRIIKPQINYKGVLIHAAEVEVSQGTQSSIEETQL